MKLRFLAGPAILIACGASQQTKTDVTTAIPDVAQCIESVVVTALGTPDITGILSHCGATIADVEKVIADLEASPDGGASASPQRAQSIAAWKAALADYKAKHPNAK